ATNLAPQDIESNLDVYVRDRSVSGSGPLDAPGNTTTRLISTGADGATSYAPSLSRSGRYLAFTSTATFATPNIAPDVLHVWLRDRGPGPVLDDPGSITTTLVSAPDEGGDACAAAGGCATTFGQGGPGGRVVSDDGSQVVFYSAAPLVPDDT